MPDRSVTLPKTRYLQHKYEDFIQVDFDSHCIYASFQQLLTASQYLRASVAHFKNQQKISSILLA